MVTDEQAKRLCVALSSGKTLAQSADKAGMDEKTARKYRRLGRLPSEVAPERTWRTRKDPFVDVWPEVHELLQEAPGLESKTLFAWLQTKYPSKFDNSQLRSFQRGVKRWRATAGPAKEVFFSQVHHPGRLCASDFTHMKSLAVTIGGQPAVRSRDVLRPRGIRMPPVLVGIGLLFLLEPSLGRFLRDKVAVQQSCLHQHPVCSGDGIPAHAHGSGDLPAGRCLLLKLVLAGTIRVDDQFGKRQATSIKRMENPHTAFPLESLICCPSGYYYIRNSLAVWS